MAVEVANKARGCDRGGPVIVAKPEAIARHGGGPMDMASERGKRLLPSVDRLEVSRMLAAAFQDDPVMLFIFPDPDVRRVRLPRLFAILYDGDGAHGARYVTEGGEAATLWRAPGQERLRWVEKLRYGLPWLRAAGSALPRALKVSAASDANHPARPHWFLHIAGCAPQVQGRGFGSAAILAGLTKADEDGLPAYLETAREANIGFYQRFGFAVTHRWHVPDGPAHWSMLREPGSMLREPGSMPQEPDSIRVLGG